MESKKEKSVWEWESDQMLESDDKIMTADIIMETSVFVQGRQLIMIPTL